VTFTLIDPNQSTYRLIDRYLSVSFFLRKEPNSGSASRKFDTQKLGLIDTRRLSVLFFLKKEPKTVVPLRGRFITQNLGLIDPSRLSVLFFFWKKKNLARLIDTALRTVGYPRTFCEAEQTLFASFSGKRRILQGPLPPLFGGLESTNLLRSRTNAFCFFFWKKKNPTRLILTSL
jgi:hypothetical protein